MGMKQAKQVTEIAERLGWSVDMYSDSIKFCKASPAGEDFSFIILTEGLSGDAELADKILDYTYDFDVEEYVKMRVGAQGHVSGVPDIKTLVRDADAIKEMLDELAAAVSNDTDATDNDDEEESVNSLEDAYEWILSNFNIDGPAGRIIHNVLEYADRMTGDEQHEFLTEMLDGTIGLSDDEIKRLCWN